MLVLLKSPRSAVHSAGVAAVEFALVLPVLMLLLAGMFVLGQAMTVRYLMYNAANQLVRACVLHRDPSEDCVELNKSRYFANLNRYCQGGEGDLGVVITPSEEEIDELPDVKMRIIDAECTLKGVVGLKMLQDKGLLSRISVRAQMPF